MRNRHPRSRRLQTAAPSAPLAWASGSRPSGAVATSVADSLIHHF